MLFSKSVLLDGRNLDEGAYRKYAVDVLPLQPHEINFETTAIDLQKLIALKKTLIQRRYERFMSTCSPLTSSHVTFREDANTIKRMDKDA